MLLKAIGSNGAVSGTGVLECSGGIFGGALINSDGTNAAVVVVRITESGGKRIMDLSTKASGMVSAPISLEGGTQIHYSVTGTNATAQFYEWVP